MVDIQTFNRLLNIHSSMLFGGFNVVLSQFHRSFIVARLSMKLLNAFELSVVVLDIQNYTYSRARPRNINTK